MLPFDLERAKKGHLLTTKNSDSVISFKEDGYENTYLKAQVNGMTHYFTSKGICNKNRDFDLFMVYEHC